MSSTTMAHYGALSRRAIATTIRQPTSILPAMLFPLMFMALSSAAFERSTSLPGFPEVDSFLQFLVVTSIIQGSLFGSVAAGAAMATDIEGGFFERLIASPVSRPSILVGRVAGGALLGFVQAIFFFAIAYAFGMRSEGGILSLAMVAVTSAVVAAGMGSIATSFALRTGSAEAVQGSFPLMFAGLFLSSAFFPRELMDGWFQTVAGANPLSHLIEGLRYQVIAGIDFGEFLSSFAIAVALFAFGTVLAATALRGRLKSGA